MTELDWRLTHQENYLKGVMLIRRQWRRLNLAGTMTIAPFAGPEFGPSPGDIHEGWTTLTESHWICDRCFADFREQFRWRVL
jgi:hypothetical protein